MWLEWEWRHTRKRWSWEFEDFEKHVSWELSLDHVGRQLGCLPLSQMVELGSDHDGEKLGPTMVWRSWDWTTRCAKRWGVVSIVWYERLLRIVSPLVSKNRNQKLIKTFVPETKESRLLAYVFVSACISVLEYVYVWLYNTWTQPDFHIMCNVLITVYAIYSCMLTSWYVNQSRTLKICHLEWRWLFLI